MLAALLCQVGFVPPPTPPPFINKPGRVWPGVYPYFKPKRKRPVGADAYLEDEEEEEELEEIMAMLGIDI